MVFTGKSENDRQGITPSRTDVSWKILLFRGAEGKVRGTLGTIGGTAGTFCGLGGEAAITAKLLSTWGHRDSEECQVCAKQRQTFPVCMTRKPMWCGY